MALGHDVPTAPTLGDRAEGITIPEVGGDTLFASMTAAYEGLSPGMQRYLDGLMAVHDFSHGFKESLAEPGGRERLADAVAKTCPCDTQWYKPILRRQESALREQLVTTRSVRHRGQLSPAIPVATREPARVHPPLAGSPTAWCSGITAVPAQTGERFLPST